MWITGKTVYLSFSLLQRLVEGLKTAILFRESTQFLFDENGAFSIIGSFDKLTQTNYLGDPGLVLFDLNYAHSVARIPDGHGWRVLVTSSPKENNQDLKKWCEFKLVKRFVMGTWDWNEVYVYWWVKIILSLSTS